MRLERPVSTVKSESGVVAIADRQLPLSGNTNMPTEALPPQSSGPTSTNRAAVRMSRRSHEGMRLLAIESSPVSEFHLTLTPRQGETTKDLAQRLAEILHRHEATIVRHIVFGSVKEQAPTVAALRQVLEDPTLPVLWVEGTSCTGGPIAGMQIHAIAGAKVRTIGNGELPLGRVWQDTVATHCVLGSLGPTQLPEVAPVQTRQVFENLQAGLAQAGMTMKDVARTWFFLDDILSWYGEFNRVRNDFFAQSELRPGSVPASTGVSGWNPAGAALVAAAWAVRSQEPDYRAVEFVASPRQCPAPAYGSAFSRAVEIHSAGFRQLLVSGTASIAPDGHTAHIDDVRSQIELSMEVVSAILASRTMQLADVSRATAYFKSPADAPLFKQWLDRRGLSELPVVLAGCDICREDLLFEIELDAIRGSH